MKSKKNNPIKPSRLPGCLVTLAFWIAGISMAAEIPKFTPEGYAVPQPGRHFVFPRDHGSHPEFALEWWYITGHLTSTDGSKFGFQATFFRRALGTPGSNDPVSSFGSRQIYLAHMGLVNQTTGTFIFEEKLNRGGWDAGSSTETMNMRNGNWSLAMRESKQDGPKTFELRGSVGANTTFQLNLVPKKPLVIFGENGVSRKASDPIASSHYLTFPRMTADGVIESSEINRPVTGEAWMDHEFSSSQLGADQVGWDWLSLQLFDGRELMAYRMRCKDGSTDPFSTVAWIDQKGEVRPIGPNQFHWEVLGHWHSPKSGANYPALVRLKAINPATNRSETWMIQPLVADQELTGKVGGVGYWEGACRVLDENKKEIGRAYMELTGYSESMKGKF